MRRPGRQLNDRVVTRLRAYPWRPVGVSRDQPTRTIGFPVRAAPEDSAGSRVRKGEEREEAGREGGRFEDEARLECLTDCLIGFTNYLVKVIFDLWSFVGLSIMIITGTLLPNSTLNQSIN